MARSLTRIRLTCRVASRSLRSPGALGPPESAPSRRDLCKEKPLGVSCSLGARCTDGAQNSSGGGGSRGSSEEASEFAFHAHLLPTPSVACLRPVHNSLAPWSDTSPIEPQIAAKASSRDSQALGVRTSTGIGSCSPAARPSRRGRSATCGGCAFWGCLKVWSGISLRSSGSSGPHRMADIGSEVRCAGPKAYAEDGGGECAASHRFWNYVEVILACLLRHSGGSSGEVPML